MYLLRGCCSLLALGQGVFTFFNFRLSSINTKFAPFIGTYLQSMFRPELDFGRVWLPCNLTAATGVSGDNEVILVTSKPASFAVKTLAPDPCSGPIVANEFSSPREIRISWRQPRTHNSVTLPMLLLALIQSSCFKFPGGVEFISSRPSLYPPCHPVVILLSCFSPHSILFLFADLICLPRRSTSLFLRRIPALDRTAHSLIPELSSLFFYCNFDNYFVSNIDNSPLRLLSQQQLRSSSGTTTTIIR